MLPCPPLGFSVSMDLPNWLGLFLYFCFLIEDIALNSPEYDCHGFVYIFGIGLTLSYSVFLLQTMQTAGFTFVDFFEWRFHQVVHRRLSDGIASLVVFYEETLILQQVVWLLKVSFSDCGNQAVSLTSYHSFYFYVSTNLARLNESNS